jgi:hypothetical protein
MHWIAFSYPTASKAGLQLRSEATDFFGEILGQDISSSLKNPFAGCSKRSQRRGALQRAESKALRAKSEPFALRAWLFAGQYVDAKSVERNEAYESFSATC